MNGLTWDKPLQEVIDGALGSAERCKGKNRDNNRCAHCQSNKNNKNSQSKKSTQKNKRKDKERRENTSFDDAILTSTLFLMTHIL